MVKFNGSSATLDQMIKNLLKRLFCPYKGPVGEQLGLIEGMSADQYTCPELKNRIVSRYKVIYFPPKTPLSNPKNYDPLNPPAGWKWDPYYEIWHKTNE
jgi:hypothetical protein